MDSKEKKQKQIGITLGLIVVLLVSCGAAFAYWALSKKQTGNNQLISACLDFDLVEQDVSKYSSTSRLTTYTVDGVEMVSGFSLDSAVPMTNQDGVGTTGYLFNIVNNCPDEAVSYYIALEEFQDGESFYISSSSINVGINEALVGTYSNLPTTAILDDSDAVDSRIIYNDSLNGGETKSYKLNLWLKSNAPISDSSNATTSKTWNSRIYVTGTIDNGNNMEYSDKLTAESCFDVDSSGTITNYHSENPNCSKDVVIPPKVNGIAVKNIATNAFREVKYNLPDDTDHAGSITDYYNYGLKINSVNLSKTTYLENIEALAFSSAYLVPGEDEGSYEMEVGSGRLNGLFFGDNTNPIVINSMAFAGAKLDNLTIYNTYKNTNIIKTELENYSEFFGGTKDLSEYSELDQMKLLSLIYGDALAYGQFGEAYINNLTIKSADDDGVLSYVQIDEYPNSFVEGVIDALSNTGLFKTCYVNNLIIDEGITSIGEGVFALTQMYSAGEGTSSILPTISLPSTIKKLSTDSLYVNDRDLNVTLNINMTESDFSNNVNKESNWLNPDLIVHYISE